MTTRRFRVTVEEAAFDAEVNADVVHVRDVAVPSGAATSPAGGEGEGPATSAHTVTFVVSSHGAEGVRVRPAVDGDGDAAAVAPHSVAADSVARAHADARALVVSDGDVTWVWIDGEVWTLEVEPAERARRPHGTSGAEGLSAPMPATVIRILAEPGHEVRRGETLLLLEAMKMELPVRAPRDGRVKALHCQPGELVQPGVTLVDLE